jgi:hypothetical protein
MSDITEEEEAGITGKVQTYIQIVIVLLIAISFVWLIPTLILTPIMELSISGFPSEHSCNELNNKTWYSNDHGNITPIDIPNETSWCIRNETGWHRNSLPLVLH